MTVALSVAAGQGVQAVVCATGNTSASAAAYAARRACPHRAPAGWPDCDRQARAGNRAWCQGGANRRNFDDCFELARKLAHEYPVALVNSVNPNRIEGQKTAAFE